jgi:LCP family protein required for cell wall assembly
MPDQPTDPPEFEWLYGADGAPGAGGPADAEPELTRILPRPAAQSTPSPHQAPPPPVPPLRTPPPRTPAAPAGRGPRRLPFPRRFPVIKVALLLILAWIAFLVATPIIAWKQVAEVDATPSGARPADQPGTTYLLVGSDSRRGLSKAENRKLGTGGVGDIGERTDTIMLLHIGSGPPILLSIPRDSLVPIPGYGVTKINAAFAYGGPKLLVRTIEQDTGVRVDHFVEIGFGGFVNAVDAVGGITICPTHRMDDPRANLHIKKGCQHVDGITALGYSRSRHTEILGDITRARHQREVVSAIGAKVKSIWTFLNPWRYHALVYAGVTSLRVSTGTSMFDLARFALAMTKVNGSSGLTCSMPISDLAVHWDRPHALELLNYIKTDRTADIPKKLCQPTGLNT